MYLSKNFSIAVFFNLFVANTKYYVSTHTIIILRVIFKLLNCKLLLIFCVTSDNTIRVTVCEQLFGYCNAAAITWIAALQ